MHDDPAFILQQEKSDERRHWLTIWTDTNLTVPGIMLRNEESTRWCWCCTRLDLSVTLTVAEPCAVYRYRGLEQKEQMMPWQHDAHVHLGKSTSRLMSRGWTSTCISPAADADRHNKVQGLEKQAALEPRAARNVHSDAKRPLHTECRSIIELVATADAPGNRKTAGR